MSTWSSPVRYGECDQQGVVFNAHYLAWADEAMTSLLLDRLDTAIAAPRSSSAAARLTVRVFACSRSASTKRFARSA